MSQKTPSLKNVLTLVGIVVAMLLCLYGGLLIDIPWLRAVLVLIAAAMVWCLMISAVRMYQISWEFWCYFLYAFGTVACVMAFFPPRELAHFEEGKGKEWTALYLGLAFFLIGGLIHALLFCLGLAGKENAKKWAIILSAIVLSTIAFTILETKGYNLSKLAPLFFLFVAVIVTLLIIVLFVLVRIMSRRMPVNQLARLIGKKSYREAVELAESLPADSRRPEVLYNLAVAYKLLGENKKAQVVFENLQTRSDVPQVIAEAIKLRLAELRPAEPL